MRINFKINETDYSIDADGNQYTLVRHGINQAKGENFGKPTESQIGYYSQVKSAVSKAVKDELGSQPIEIGLKEFIQRYEFASQMVLDQIGNK